VRAYAVFTPRDVNVGMSAAAAADPHRMDFGDLVDEVD
jgi:hypothetical protein